MFGLRRKISILPAFSLWDGQLEVDEEGITQSSTELLKCTQIGGKIYIDFSSRKQCSNNFFAHSTRAYKIPTKREAPGKGSRNIKTNKMLWTSCICTIILYVSESPF